MRARDEPGRGERERRMSARARGGKLISYAYCHHDASPEKSTHLLRDAFQQANIVGRPTAVELAQREVDVRVDGDQRSVRVDEGDDGSNEGIVDVGQVRGEELRAKLVSSQVRTAPATKHNARGQTP